MPGRSFVLALALTALITPLSVHLFLPVIPAVKAAFHLDDAWAQLMFSVSLFGMAFATLVYGSLSDRYGRRPVLLSGIALFLIGSVASALAQTATMLVLARLVQAIGAGCGMTLTRTIARDAYRPEHLIKAIAYLTMFYTIGPMVSPLIGGLLVDTFGWRSVFGFAVAVGCVIAIMVYGSIHETRPVEVAAAPKTGIATDYAALFSRLRFTAFVLQSGLITGMFMTIASASASLMQELLHRPAAEFGLYFLLFPAGFLAGNFISTRVGNRARAETMVLIGSALALAAVVTQAAVLSWAQAAPLMFFLPGTFVTMAQGLSLPYAQVGAMAEIPRLAGTASGIGVFMQHFGAAFFAQLYGLFADGTPRPMIGIAVLVGILCLIVGALPLLRTRPSTPP